MCLLTFFPDGVFPNIGAIQGLQHGAKFNSDGHGYAMIDGDRIISHKGLDAEKVIDQFLIDRSTFPNGPALFHSRIGTDGWLSEDNCHPFQIGKDERTVLAHNGILPTLARPTEKHDPRSDTRILAEELLPSKPFGYFHSRLAREAFEAWLGPYNKVLILTTNPRYPVNAMIFNESKGSWDMDAWWSNDSYMPYFTRGYVIGKSHSGKDGSESASVVDRSCPNTKCLEKDCVDPDYRVCWLCGYCADCLASWRDGECICYIKTRGGSLTPVGNRCNDCEKDLDSCTC